MKKIITLLSAFLVTTSSATVVAACVFGENNAFNILDLSTYTSKEKTEISHKLNNLFSSYVGERISNKAFITKFREETNRTLMNMARSKGETLFIPVLNGILGNNSSHSLFDLNFNGSDTITKGSIVNLTIAANLNFENNPFTGSLDLVIYISGTFDLNTFYNHVNIPYVPNMRPSVAETGFTNTLQNYMNAYTNNKITAQDYASVSPSFVIKDTYVDTSKNYSTTLTAASSSSVMIGSLSNMVVSINGALSNSITLNISVGSDPSAFSKISLLSPQFLAKLTTQVTNQLTQWSLNNNQIPVGTTLQNDRDFSINWKTLLQLLLTDSSSPLTVDLTRVKFLVISPEIKSNLIYIPELCTIVNVIWNQ